MKKFIFLIILFAPFYVNAAGNILKIATPEWINQTNTDGSGLYFDIIRAVYESEGYTVQYSIVPWERAKYMVKSGQSDIMPGDIRTSTNDFIFPEQIFLNETTSAVFQKETCNWSGKSSLKDIKCIWLTGYDYQKTLGVNTIWYEIDNRNAALKAVLARRSDYFIDAKIDISYYFKKHPEQINLFEIKDIYTVDLYLKFSNNSRGKRLSDIYERRLKTLKNNRKFREIFKKYNYNFPLYK